MPTAFGQAMLDSLAGREQTFLLSFNGGPAMAQPCGAFLALRPDEVGLLGAITLPEGARVLDYGCGAGRHLQHLRAARADIHCVGIEVCDGLRAHCATAVAAPATFVADWPQARQHGPFDLILMMGNGLGVLGDEAAAEGGLGELVDTLAPGGRLVIETGNPFGRGYRTDVLKIRYGKLSDGPFPWGGADRAWGTGALEALGCEVTLSESNAPGNFFFAVATKRPEPRHPAPDTHRSAGAESADADDGAEGASAGTGAKRVRKWEVLGQNLPENIGVFDASPDELAALDSLIGLAVRSGATVYTTDTGSGTNRGDLRIEVPNPHRRTRVVMTIAWQPAKKRFLIRCQCPTEVAAVLISHVDQSEILRAARANEPQATEMFIRSPSARLTALREVLIRSMERGRVME